MAEKDNGNAGCELVDEVAEMEVGSGGGTEDVGLKTAGGTEDTDRNL